MENDSRLAGVAMEEKEILFALPYAGGSALSYSSWKKCFVNKKFVALDYAGHGSRMTDMKMPNDITEMAEDIISQISDYLKGERFSIFGHSMGGLVAWHTLRGLQRRGLWPQKIYISACAAPNKISDIKRSDDDDKIIYELRNEGHLTDEMAKTPFFLNNILPIVRNDYKVLKEYVCEESIVKEDLLLYLFYGDQDIQNSIEVMLPWKEFVVKEPFITKFAGGHFFFDNKEEMLKLCAIMDQ